jgi:hypothetical protein
MIYIQTMNNKVYIITSANEIIRTDLKGFAPSGQWLFRGLVHRHRRHPGEGLNERAFIRPEDLRAMLASGVTPDWRYKNGNPRFTVADYDHGAHREWGDGVKRVWWRA